MRTTLLPLALLCGVLAVPAAHGQAPAPRLAAGEVAYFEKNVRPLLVARCFKCHSSKSNKQRGGLRLDSGAALLQGGDSGPAVTPGAPEKSLLVKAIRYGDPTLQMPPTGKLSERDIAVLVAWVQQGAPFPGPRDAATATAGIDVEQGRKFWSFQRPHPVPPPATRNRTWSRTALDPFLLAALEKRGLHPSAPASRRVLIRRATFDLIGLPPTPAEVEAFVNDTAADAYPRLLDRLLASPHYGERWGRYWLDLARYCDIGESWSESKGKASLYRDWVVRAFNEDMPYPRMVQLQLAADLMPGAACSDRAALGFLGLSPTYWKELKLDQDVIRTVVAEEWEERIAAVSSTFLGLTVACARCHDHKFDPITTADYYALAGILASTRLADQPLVPDLLAGPALEARAEAARLQTQIQQVQKQKPLPPAAARQMAELQRRMDALRLAPFFDLPLAPGVDEASLDVLPDGPHRTRLNYRPGVAQDVPIQIRGNPAREGPAVPRRFLTVLSPTPPPRFTQGSGRLELARAIVAEGAPLSARVMVNRVWKHHFGAGLVETPSDFGAQGERPSHPELLDDLTARFMAAGWSLKWLHREIMLSAAYQQASAAGAPQHAVDPDNRLLWRMHRRRLDVEAWRDAMLAVTGTLDCTVGGPSRDLGDPGNRRRTLYGTVKRRELNDLLRLNDFPDPTAQ